MEKYYTCLILNKECDVSMQSNCSFFVNNECLVFSSCIGKFLTKNKKIDAVQQITMQELAKIFFTILKKDIDQYQKYADEHITRNKLQKDHFQGYIDTLNSAKESVLEFIKNGELEFQKDYIGKFKNFRDHFYEVIQNIKDPKPDAYSYGSYQAALILEKGFAEAIAMMRIRNNYEKELRRCREKERKSPTVNTSFKI